MMQQRYLFQESVPVHFCGHSFSKDDHQFLMLFSLSFVVKLKMYHASFTFVQYNKQYKYLYFIFLINYNISVKFCHSLL